MNPILFVFNVILSAVFFFNVWKIVSKALFTDGFLTLCSVLVSVVCQRLALCSSRYTNNFTIAVLLLFNIMLVCALLVFH